MRNRRDLSQISSPCRCEWRPSRWQAAATILLGAGAVVALMSCAMERGYAIPMAFGVVAYSAWRCRRELRQQSRQLLIPSPPSPVLIDGGQVTDVELLERGPLTLLRWRSGCRREACVFWPDTFSRAQRRELRLAVRARAVSRDAPTVAP